MKFSGLILLSVISCVYSQAVLQFDSPGVNFVQNQNNYGMGLENELNLVLSNYIWTVTQVLPDTSTGTIARVNVNVNPNTNIDPNQADEEFVSRRGNSIDVSLRFINQVQTITILAQDTGAPAAAPPPPQGNQNAGAGNVAATQAPVAADNEDIVPGLSTTELIIVVVVVFFGLLTMMILAIILIRRAKRNNNRRTGNRGIETRFGGQEADNRLQTTWQAGAEQPTTNNLISNNLGGSQRSVDSAGSRPSVGTPVQQVRKPVGGVSVLVQGTPQKTYAAPAQPTKTYAAPAQPTKTYAAPLQSNKTAVLSPAEQEEFRQAHPQFKNTLANFGQ